MKISSLVLASSAHAAWEDKWNTMVAEKTRTMSDVQGYIDFQLRDCIAARESMKMANPIENGQWKCNDPAKTGRATCEAVCQNDWHDQNWHRMQFSIKCKEGLKMREQMVGERSCSPRERGIQCWQEPWADAAIKSFFKKEGFENAEVDRTKCRKNRKRRALCPIRCKPGFAPRWSFKRQIYAVFNCPSKQWVWLNPSRNKIRGKTTCVALSYDCNAADANKEYPLANGSWECRKSETGLYCEPKCNAADTVRYRVKCTTTGFDKGWSVSTYEQFSNDVCEFESDKETTDVEFQETTDFIPAGLNTCTTDSNFPASRGFPGLDDDYRIVGGVTVQANSIPWAVLLHVKTYSGWTGQCAGSILSEHWVVTAAHCCRGIRSITGKFGEHNKYHYDQTSEFSLTTDNIFIHPKYYDSSDDGTKMNYDVCLLKFDEDILARAPNKEAVKPICLPTEDVTHGDACWVAGWGTTSYGGFGAAELQSVGVSIMDHNYCMDKSFSIDPQEDDICATTWDKNHDGFTDSGKDACQGDSGGALICNRDGFATVVGVVSRGNGCAYKGEPGLYTSTFVTKDWIVETVKTK